MHRSVRHVATLIALPMILLAGCGGTASPTAGTAATGGPKPAATGGPKPAAPATSKPLQKVTFRMDWLIRPDGAGFVVAKEKGYYRDAGLDVDILEGKGAPATAEAVASGSDTFGKADAGVVANLINKGAPLKLISVYLQKTPFSLIYKEGTPYSSPKDLAGKTIIATPGDVNLKLLPAVLAKYGVSMNQVNIKSVDQQVKISAFLSSKDEFTVGFLLGDYLAIKAKDPGVRGVSFAEYGVSPYSNGLIASLDEIRNHPDLARAFVAATTKGWAYTEQHPDEAVDDILKEFPKADRKFMADGLALTLQELHTENTKGHPIGWMSEADWRNTLEILEKYEGLTNPKPLDQYYTNQFLPQS